ncbi:hypothetical protein C7T87_17645 [Xanthomonas hortorum pv. hederae]|nr:hypothetical protein C7T87_17645 [Xanthomonas hortorum pv. hederae]
MGVQTGLAGGRAAASATADLPKCNGCNGALAKHRSDRPGRRGIAGTVADHYTSCHATAA